MYPSIYLYIKGERETVNLKIAPFKNFPVWHFSHFPHLRCNERERISLYWAYHDKSCISNIGASGLPITFWIFTLSVMLFYSVYFQSRKCYAREDRRKGPHPFLGTLPWWRRSRRRMSSWQSLRSRGIVACQGCGALSLSLIFLLSYYYYYYLISYSLISRMVQYLPIDSSKKKLWSPMGIMYFLMEFWNNPMTFL